MGGNDPLANATGDGVVLSCVEEDIGAMEGIGVGEEVGDIVVAAIDGAAVVCVWESTGVVCSDGTLVGSMAGVGVTVRPVGASVGMNVDKATGLNVGPDVILLTGDVVVISNTGDSVVGSTTGDSDSVVGDIIGASVVGDTTGAPVVDGKVGLDCGTLVEGGGGGGTVKSQQPRIAPKSLGQQFPNSSAHRV